MNQYKTFVFEELSKNHVVHMHHGDNIENDKNDIINCVVSKHLHDIVNNSEDQNEDNTQDLDDTMEQEAIKIAHNNDNRQEHIDIEKLKTENYEKGVEDTKYKYEEMLNQQKIDYEFSELLRSKLSSIELCNTIDHDLIKLSTQIVIAIIKKMYMIVPVDFEKLLQEKLITLASSLYKEGAIIFSVNPSRYELCTKILQTDSVSDALRGKLQLIKNDALGKNDCKIEFNDTCLQYTQDDIMNEANQILDQLKV